MSIQGKTPTNKIYDRFRSSDDQINFLMSQQGEMQLDREIIKMMKQMNADEIVQFANQFFKYKENQCQSLHQLVSKQLSMRKDESEEQQQFANKVQQFQFQTTMSKGNNIDRKSQMLVSNLNSLPDILAEMSNIQKALEEDFISSQSKNNNNFQQGQNSKDQEDRIDFQQYNKAYEDYVPQVYEDEEYLTQNISQPQQQEFLEFDKLPAYMLLTPEQIKEIDESNTLTKNSKINDQIKIQFNKQKDQRKQFKKEQIKQSQSVKQNLVPEQKAEAQEIQQNPQQASQQVPTTVQENQQFDFQEIQRISLPDNKYKITYNNGDQYQGELQNQMKNGWGDYHYNTGERYQGFFVDDQIHGYGQYFFLSGASYEGDWSSGMKHGVGILKFSNGDSYQGQFVKDQFHGKGTYNYANGDVFTGLWKKGQKHGKGKLQTYDGSLQMGNWVYDKFQI